MNNDYTIRIIDDDNVEIVLNDKIVCKIRRSEYDGDAYAIRGCDVIYPEFFTGKIKDFRDRFKSVKMYLLPSFVAVLHKQPYGMKFVERCVDDYLRHVARQASL